MLRDSIWWVMFVVWAGLLFLEPGIPAGFAVMFFGKLFVAASVLALGIVGVATRLGETRILTGVLWK